MLRRDRQFRTQIHQLLDAGTFAFALWLAYWLRSLWKIDLLPSSHPVGEFQHYLWLYLIIIPGAPLVLESQGYYARGFLGSGRAVMWILLKACFLVTLGVVLVMFFFKIDLARTIVMLFGGVSFLLMMLKEQLLRMGYRSTFGELAFRKRFLLIGGPQETQRMREELESAGDGASVVGELDLNTHSIADLVKTLHLTSPNGVILLGKRTLFGQVEKAIQACEREGVEAWLIADFFQTRISRTSFDDFRGRPVLVFRSTPEVSWQGVVKQLIDTAGAAVLVTAGVPVFLGVAAAIRITSPGPILFRQQRCGLNGRPFTMLKFRSMVTDAEQRQHELETLNEMSGPVFKVTHDPRITPVGRFLRKYSLDELPQLFNVLRGEMSLVGPRPLPVYEVERFDDPAHRRRLSVKPGLTCLWQVSGRNKVRDFQDWVRLDLEYIDNWSLWLDLKILCRTIPVVLTGAGAK